MGRPDFGACALTDGRNVGASGCGVFACAMLKQAAETLSFVGACLGT